MSDAKPISSGPAGRAAALPIAGIVAAVTVSNKRSVSGAVEIADASSKTPDEPTRAGKSARV